MLLGSSIGALVALRYAARYPERPARLVLASVVSRYVHARSIAAFDELGGAEAGEVAARYFGDPSETSFAEYLRVCLPLYSRTPLDPEVLARARLNPEATIHWDRSGAPRVDLRGELGAVGCPVLLLAGACEPTFTLAGTEELAAALSSKLVELRRYPHAGYGVYRDAPEAIDDAIRFVLGSEARDGRSG